VSIYTDNKGTVVN